MESHDRIRHTNIKQLADEVEHISYVYACWKPASGQAAYLGELKPVAGHL